MRNATDDELNSFRPTPYSEEELRAIHRQMIADLNKMVEESFFLGKSVSTASSTPPPTLTIDSIKEMIALLSTPKPRKYRSFDPSKPIRVFVDKNCYKRRTEVYGLADARRPNNKKMLYRKRTVIIPLIVRAGNDIVCHPAREAELRSWFDIGEPKGPFGSELPGFGSSLYNKP